MKKTIVIIGAGPGLGNHIAKKFGRNNFRVVLIARNPKSLQQYQHEFTDEGIESFTYVADTSSPQTLTTAFNAIKKEVGPIDVLIYNVGITKPDDQPNLSSQTLTQNFQTEVASAFHSVQQVVDQNFSQRNGTIIFTGGYAALSPIKGYLSLALDKAALRNLALALHNELKSKNIFVGTVTVAGVITKNTHFSPELIASTFWRMYQGKNEWEIIYQ